MIEQVESQFKVPTGGSFKIDSLSTVVKGERDNKLKLKQTIKKIDKLQRRLYAQDSYSLLLIFQAMDAAGKDSTIRAVTKGLNPAGFQVHSFKQPSKKELDHDFLWRSAKALPERGRIGIFNRSYYEEVLVVKVHPDYLNYQKLPTINQDIWQQRYQSICDHEKHLASNGTVILKFWLNVSKKEQTRRFISRIENKRKNWKFSTGDLKEADLWEKYMDAYQKMITATSTPHAPWYVIGADHKPTMRLEVATIIKNTLENINPQYPSLDENTLKQLETIKIQLIKGLAKHD